jgi:hypothetical protein
MKIGTIATLAVLSALGSAGALPGATGPVPAACSAAEGVEGTTSAAPALPVDPSAYYAVDLVTTKNLPGTGRARGTGHLAFARSPYGVALAADGSYRYEVNLQLSEIDRPAQGTLVAWITTPQVDRTERLGAFDENLRAHGQVSWNKFLVVVTLEPSDDASARTWSGPIVLRGMSRSGAMHTMAGHGPFQQELCARYGYR